MANTYVMRDKFLVSNGAATKGQETYLKTDEVSLQGSTITTNAGGDLTITPRGGDIVFAADLDFNGELAITSTTTPQLTVAYDATNYVAVAAASDGKTTLTPTGTAPDMTIATDTAVTGELTVTSTTTPQLTAAYDGSNSFNVSVDSSGFATVSSTGNKIFTDDEQLIIAPANPDAGMIAIVPAIDKDSIAAGDASLYIINANSAYPPRDIRLGTYTTANFEGIGTNLRFDRSHGLFATPAAVLNNDYMGDIEWFGHDGTSLYQTATIRCRASENFVNGTNGGSLMSFQTTEAGTATRTTKMNIGAMVSTLVPLSITSTSTQLDVAYDGANNTTIATDSNGYCTITPSGSRLLIGTQDYVTVYNASGNWTGARTAAYTHKLTLRGDLVTLEIDELADGASIANGVLTADTAIGSGYRPSASVYGVIPGLDNGAAAFLRVTVQASGIIVIGVGAGGAAFTNITNCGVRKSSLSWYV